MSDQPAQQPVTPGHMLSPRRCSACYEIIHPSARICPHCRTAQAKSRLVTLGHALKWIGSITAVLSLVFAMVQLRSLVADKVNRDRAVFELLHPKIDVDLYFERALEKEPDNVYANAWYGWWLLKPNIWISDDRKHALLAIPHFRQALSSGRESVMARTLQIDCLMGATGGRAFEYSVCSNDEYPRARKNSRAAR